MSYMYLKFGTTHFYRLALYNLVLSLTDILLKSKLFTWWMSHGDMTDYGHVTIIWVLLGQIIRVFIGILLSYTHCSPHSRILIFCEHLFLTCLFLHLKIYKARFFVNFLGRFICLLKLCRIWLSQASSPHDLDFWQEKDFKTKMTFWSSS